MITVIMISITEEMKRIIPVNLNGYKLSFKFSLPQQSQSGENASMQIISQEKDPAVGINGFEGVGPEWLLPQKKESLFAFWKKVRFEGGERETNLLVYAP